MSAVKKLLKLLGYVFLIVGIVAFNPSLTQAKLDSSYKDGIFIQRSLESLRDLDSQTWQIVAYPQGEEEMFTTLRIVGYPGSLRLDHPQDLIVKSGIKEWRLHDITLGNPQLALDRRESAAEFNLDPLLVELTQNRPLRLFLSGAFNELPVPPYIVKEWRTLKASKVINHEL